MALIHAFQGLPLIRHKEEINRRSRGAPASIPLQPSVQKPCLPSRPLTPSNPVWSWWWCILQKNPIVSSSNPTTTTTTTTHQWGGVKAYHTVGPPPTPAARDWLTTHLLHAACPLLYCVSIIINNLACLTGMTVINACWFKFVKGCLCVGCVHCLGLLCDSSWFLKV